MVAPPGFLVSSVTGALASRSAQVLSFAGSTGPEKPACLFDAGRGSRSSRVFGLGGGRSGGGFARGGALAVGEGAGGAVTTGTSLATAEALVVARTFGGGLVSPGGARLSQSESRSAIRRTTARIDGRCSNIAPVRKLGHLLVLALGAASLPQASARPEPAPARLPARERPAEARVEPVPPVVAPRVVEVAPVGERVPLDAPVVVRFDADVPEAMRRGLVELEPAVPGEARWLDARAYSFVPKRWRQGRPERVVVRTAEPVEWTFRTRVPMPLAAPAGEGARLILSFDDGPNDRRQADRLLDRLKQLGIRALFFPSGRWARTRPDWVERARMEGHRVCNHTLSHVNLTAPWMTEARVREEIAGGAGDGECKLFRPPLMGVDARVERIAKELGYETYLWDVDSRDWEGGPKEDVLATVLGRARPDGVVLFHIHAESTHEILPLLAEKLREAGYVLSWDPKDAPTSRVGEGGRPEWGALEDRRNGADPLPDDAGGFGLGPP